MSGHKTNVNEIPIFYIYKSVNSMQCMCLKRIKITKLRMISNKMLCTSMLRRENVVDKKKIKNHQDATSEGNQRRLNILKNIFVKNELKLCDFIIKLFKQVTSINGYILLFTFLGT